MARSFRLRVFASSKESLRGSSMVCTQRLAAAADGEGPAMTWEEQLFAYLDDLEQQAEGVFGIERDLEVAERAAAEYAAVTAASRLMASVDRQVTVQVRG